MHPHTLLPQQVWLTQVIANLCLWLQRVVTSAVQQQIFSSFVAGQACADMADLARPGECCSQSPEMTVQVTAAQRLL